MTPILTMGRALSAQARLQPERIGVRDLERAMSFALWNERACRLANALMGLGLEKGDRVAALAYNRIEWVEIYAACAKAGLVAVPVRLHRGCQGLLPRVLRLVQPGPSSRRDRPHDPGPGALRTSRCGLRRTPANPRSGLPRPPRALRQPTSKTTGEANCHLDQPASPHDQEPRLNANSGLIKVVDTFRGPPHRQAQPEGSRGLAERDRRKPRRHADPWPGREPPGTSPIG